MKVTTAVLFASGFGSRMLPVTAAVQKELLPVLDRPLIDYVVADCLAAGVEKFIFVVRPNSRALQDYYTGNTVLQDHLRRFGKEKVLEQLQRIHQQATYSFVEQPADAGYGTAVPLQVAAKHLPADEAFIVCGGDDFLWRTDGGSDMADLVKTFTHANATGALMTLEMPNEVLSKYGVLDVAERDGYEYLRRFVEKPTAGQAPSNLINISKYILTPKLLEYVLRVKPNAESGGELYITDAVRDAALKYPVVVRRAKGEFLDGGSVSTWLHANLTVAAARPDLAAQFSLYKK